MKNLIFAIPALALAATVLTSCTTVVERPVDSTVSTTTTRESALVTRPAATQSTTTTTRSTGP